MKIEKVKKLIAPYLDDSEVFAAITLRDEADEHLKNHHEGEAALSDDEWVQVIRLMEVDDAIWREIYNAMEYYIEATVKKRSSQNVSSQ